MAFIGIKIPPQFGEILYNIDIPLDKKTIVEKMHITLAYFGYAGDVIPNFDPSKVANIAKNVVMRNDNVSILVTTKTITYFPVADDLNAIVALIESEHLHQLQSELASAFDNNNIQFSKDFAFNPHITLGYSTEKFNSQIEEIAFKVHNIVLWGGIYGDILIE